MRKLALLAFLGVVIAGRPAEACGRNHCSPVIDVFAGALALAMIGGYATGTGYFIYRDATDEQQSIGYGATELAMNGSLAALMVPVAIQAARGGHEGTAAIVGALGVTHTALAIHGAYRIHTEWQDRYTPDMDKARPWIGGIAYGANTLAWTAMLPGRHGRTYGIVEASVNAPIALGTAYLAIDRIGERERGAALLYGGMAVVSGAFALHGIRTAIDPDEAPGIDLLGTDVMPAIVDDGPGVSLNGTW